MQASVILTPEQLKIEPWQTLALVCAGSGTIICDLLDWESRTIPWVNTQGVEVAALSLAIGSTPGSIAWFAAQAGYSAATGGIPRTVRNEQEARSICILNIGAAPISWNLAGTENGSGTQGLRGSTGRGPNPLGPRLLQPGDQLYVGTFFSPVVE